ncbi:PEP/pyruvate-binding domain-containing protein [Sphingobium lignivorans]|uniref:Phosphoenolpyruvate synthase n=1 Tax=Sphingobium lignivorans TaxID=2735886 RepID=A0ABR6NC55_9SPHN|nr:PEP/pyruvate-binding domain-containing protein [Sphingobium lignivorans]MBB5984651.1 pyruvate,water dikinase [Sphingobium lignivorans]
MTAAVSWFPDLRLTDRPTVGGKGASLGELTHAGIDVPPGFVVTTQAFELFLDALERSSPVRALVERLDPNDLDTVSRISRSLRVRVENEPLPATVETAILDAHATLAKDNPALTVAVRSSATTEDAEDASFAGLQDTFLWVPDAQDAIHRVRECWGSLYSVESICYRRKHGLPEDGVAMAVVVQTMVDARTAGVMFTRSPTTGDKSVITIEGAWGLGSAVVSGEVTPDRWVMGKITGEISVRDISDKHIRQVPAAGGGIVDEEVPAELRKTPCLSDEELQALRGVGRRIEKNYGRAQDIEWAIDKSGALLLLQSRPETVWSAKEQKPVAPVIDDPLKHVMTIFGGRR